MAKFVMIDPVISVAGTDLSDHVASFSITVEAPEVETTGFGDRWRTRLGGIKSGSVTISFHSDFAAGSVAQTLHPLLGTYATVIARPTAGSTANAGTVVCLVNGLTPIGGALGDLATQDVTWPTSGSVTGWYL